MANDLIGRCYKSQFLHQIVAALKNLQDKKYPQSVLSLFYPLALYCEKGPKTTIFMGMEK